MSNNDIDFEGSMSTPEKIRAARRAKRFTQQDLANAVSVHVASVRAWEAGAKPRAAMLQKIAWVLGVAPDFLLSQEELTTEEEFDLEHLLRELAQKIASRLGVEIERVKVVATISPAPPDGGNPVRCFADC